MIPKQSSVANYESKHLLLSIKTQTTVDMNRNFLIVPLILKMKYLRTEIRMEQEGMRRKMNNNCILDLSFQSTQVVFLILIVFDD